MLSRYSRPCDHHRSTPINEPSPTVPSMNGRATGIAIQATTVIPIETTAPAFVPGTGMFPKASRCGWDFRRCGVCSNTSPQDKPRLLCVQLHFILAQSAVRAFFREDVSPETPKALPTPWAGPCLQFPSVEQ